MQPPSEGEKLAVAIATVADFHSKTLTESFREILSLIYYSRNN